MTSRIARALVTGSRRSTVVLVATAYTLSAACHPRGDEERERSEVSVPMPPNDTVRHLLAAELRPRELSSGGAAIQVTPDSSSVIPDLAYFWGSRADGPVHGGASAVVARRGSRVQILNTPAEWSAVVGDWAPKSDDEAITACDELVEVVGPSRGRPSQRFGVRTMTAIPRDLVVDTAALHRLHGARVNGRRDGWRVELWVLERSDARKYECRFPSRGASVLSVRDSVAEAGFLPIPP